MLVERHRRALRAETGTCVPCFSPASLCDCIATA
jgi:hypothetical protein